MQQSEKQMGDGYGAGCSGEAGGGHGYDHSCGFQAQADERGDGRLSRLSGRRSFNEREGEWPGQPRPSEGRSNIDKPVVEEPAAITGSGFLNSMPEQTGYNENTEDTEPGQPGLNSCSSFAEAGTESSGEEEAEHRRGGLSASQAESLAERLEAYREWHSLTQHEFADLAGFSRNTVNNIESGRGASKAVRKKLARTFGISPAALFNPRIRWRAPGRNKVLSSA